MITPTEPNKDIYVIPIKKDCKCIKQKKEN